jgi:hypothetical protein
MKFSHASFVIFTLAALLIVTPAFAGDSTPADVFSKLKMMEGTWDANAAQTAGEPVVEEASELTSQHEFSVSGAGSVVMEVMGAGSEHEMINMYHMDGDDLVLTHYCAAGNQPTMKLDSEMLAAGTTHFDFTGGTNMEPGDQHIHSVTWGWQEDDSVVADWTAWAGGEQQAVMQFVLTRSE